MHLILSQIFPMEYKKELKNKAFAIQVSHTGKSSDMSTIILSTPICQIGMCPLHHHDGIRAYYYVWSGGL